MSKHLTLALALALALPSLALPSLSLAGDNAANLLRTARYMKVLHDTIQRKWQPKGVPLMLQHRLSATATLWLSPKGKLKKVKLTRPSGYKAFDTSLLAAIKQASPYPAPPLTSRKSATKVGLDIFFRRRVFHKKLLPLQRTYKGSNRIDPNWKPKRKTPPKKKKK